MGVGSSDVEDSWEKDVEDWIGASVWRVGRTAEDRLMSRNE